MLHGAKASELRGIVKSLSCRQAECIEQSFHFESSQACCATSALHFVPADGNPLQQLLTASKRVLLERESFHHEGYELF